MKERVLTKHILRILIVIFAIIFCVSAYILIEHYIQGRQAEQSYEKIREESFDKTTQSDSELMQAALRKLYEQNPDLVGWLNVFNTGISYPVMQTPSNPEYYLRKNFDKEYSVAGSLFAAAKCDIEKPSDVIVIYGHHMKNGTMFGPLVKYEKKEFYEEHRTLRFDTLDERREYEIVNVFVIEEKDYISNDPETGFTYHSYTDFDDEADFNNFMSKAEKRSLYDTGITVDYCDELILLSTCEYSTKDGRLAVLAKRVE
jgi:sortase B